MKTTKLILFLIIFIFVFIFSYFLIFEKLLYIFKYPKPVYVQNGGFWGSAETRCLCYGEIRQKINITADPTTYNYCHGWENRSSCELSKDGKSWSRENYIKKYGEKNSFRDWFLLKIRNILYLLNFY